jgi:hypothetical protein
MPSDVPATPPQFVKISDATPAAPLSATDLVPVARAGEATPYSATIQDFATYVTVLASMTPPPTSDPAGAGTAGVREEYARADHQHPTNPDVAMSTSPTFLGTPTAPTPPKDDNSTLLATTAYVVGQASTKPPLLSSVADPGLSLRYAREDHVHPLPPAAPLDSPQFVGTPRAPTPGIDDDSDIIATTEYVQNQGSTEQPTMNGTSLPGVSRRWSREDHVHPVDTTRYAASNPDGYVTAAGAAAVAPVQSVAGRLGTITLTHDDITDWTASMAAYAPLASPPLTGQPTAPTPPLSDASTRLATTAFTRAGTATNDNAAAGQIGEYQGVQRLSTNGVTLTTGVDAVLTSFVLTPGDWDVWGSVGFTLTNNNSTQLGAWINPTGTVSPPVDHMGGNAYEPISNNVNGRAVLPVTHMRISIASSTTITLGTNTVFSGGTHVAWGKLMARRVR